MLFASVLIQHLENQSIELQGSSLSLEQVKYDVNNVVNQMETDQKLSQADGQFVRDAVAQITEVQTVSFVAGGYNFVFEA